MPKNISIKRNQTIQLRIYKRSFDPLRNAQRMYTGKTESSVREHSDH